jgi:excinuclease ABC subunit A
MEKKKKEEIFKYGSIRVKGARQNNLKNITIEIPKNRLVIFTGPSGSGKSTLAFETIYIEGQRRYVESLSPYARQFLGISDKPEYDLIEGLSPSIAINQKTVPRNPRSTVGTITEIYDYLRLMYARVGEIYDPYTGIKIETNTIDEIVDEALKFTPGTRLIILSPKASGERDCATVLRNIKEAGFVRVRIDGETVEIRNTIPELDEKVGHTIDIVIDRIVVPETIDHSFRERLNDSIESALNISEGRVKMLDYDSGKEVLFNQKALYSDGTPVLDLTPASFSFNSPQGACPDCHGLGTKLEISEDLIISNKSLSINDGAIIPLTTQVGKLNWIGKVLDQVSSRYKFSLDDPLNKISDENIQRILYGTGGEEYVVEYEGGSFTGSYKTTYEGIIPNIERRYKETSSDFIRSELERFMEPRVCTLCSGQRLRREVLAVKISGYSIIDICDVPSVDILQIFEDLIFEGSRKKIAEPILKEVKRRLSYLNSVGLPYLTLSRTSSTLSGGEAQRIRLASQVGSDLSGVIYVLDEPSIGLHPRDTERLMETIQSLRDTGNTVIVVEHDEDSIKKADYIYDFGPKAGELGGEITAEGTLEDIKNNPQSLTGQYISGKKKIPVPPETRAMDLQKHSIEIIGAKANNLKSVSVKVPLGVFIAVTGVSGSGKSTLVNDILAKSLMRKFYRSKEEPGPHSKILGMSKCDKAIIIDQSPIGKTPKSNPATYTGLFALIRDLFASTPAAKARGYKPGRFSFNVKGGRCEACQGEGYNRVEMQFLPDVYVECEVCGSRRYNKETLEVTFKNKNIADVLEMTAEEALMFFDSIAPIKRKLEVLNEVGLGYIRLGQPATTLSGGEVQRIKLASELAKKSTGHTFYILDEPTTGLHFDDIKKLLIILHRLVDQGNTVMVIEHDLDVIKTVDYIIDLGPEGGDAGGEIMATGTPCEVAQNDQSITGQFLKRFFNS